MKGHLTTPEMQLRFTRWFDAAPIYSGSIAANRFGWQVLRTRAKNGAITVRRAIHRDHADSARLPQSWTVTGSWSFRTSSTRTRLAACAPHSTTTPNTATDPRRRIRERLRHPIPQRTGPQRCRRGQRLDHQRRARQRPANDRAGRARDRSSGERPAPGDPADPRGSRHARRHRP